MEVTDKSIKWPEVVSLDFLLDKKLPVYIYNRSANPKGQIALTYFRPDNSMAILKIYKTFIPICISPDQINHKALENCDDFRKCINNSMIELLDPRDAIAKLKDPMFEAEKKRLSLSKFADDPSSASKYSQKGNPGSEDGNITTLVEQLEQEEMVTPLVQDLVERSEKNQEEKVLLLMAEDSLVENDYKFIVAKTEQGPLREFAENKLAESEQV